MNLSDIRVVILAGGKGQRLKPYTTIFPKPLMPIGDMPILEIVLRQLRYYGFKKITLSVNHLANLIQSFFGDGSDLGLEIDYCIEDKPLGTAGSISLVENLTEDFLVMNGDLLTTIDYSEIVKKHISEKSVATIGSFTRNVKIDFGVLSIDSKNELIGYEEKPQFDYLVSMGVNVFNKDTLDFIEYGEYLDIPTLMLKLKNNKKKVYVHAPKCEWLDIGRPDDYENAIAKFHDSYDLYVKKI